MDTSTPPESQHTTPGDEAHPHKRRVTLAELDHELAEQAEQLLEEHQAPRAGPHYTLWSAIFCLAVAVGAIIGAVQLGPGSLLDPGPGLWPLALGVALAGLSVILIITYRTYDDAEKFTKKSLLAMWGSLSLVVMVILMPQIGFEIAAGLTCAFWLKILGRESWLSTIIGTVLIVGVFYLIFITALQAPIPRLI